MKDQNFFEGSKTDKNDGFIHFSTSKQLKGPLKNISKFKRAIVFIRSKY